MPKSECRFDDPARLMGMPRTLERTLVVPAPADESLRGEILALRDELDRLRQDRGREMETARYREAEMRYEIGRVRETVCKVLDRVEFYARRVALGHSMRELGRELDAAWRTVNRL